MRSDRPTEADPSSLTTTQILREVAGLREVLETRLDAMDKAMELFNANLTRVPTETDKQVEHLKELHEHKFAAYKEIALERNRCTEDAIDKTEININNQLKNIQETLVNGLMTANEKIAMNGTRIDRMESIAVNQAQQKTEKRLDTGAIIALVSLGLLVVSVAAAVFGFNLKN